jgi:hypothetical protein
VYAVIKKSREVRSNRSETGVVVVVPTAAGVITRKERAAIIATQQFSLQRKQSEQIIINQYATVDANKNKLDKDNQSLIFISFAKHVIHYHY